MWDGSMWADVKQSGARERTVCDGRDGVVIDRCSCGMQDGVVVAIHVYRNRGLARQSHYLLPLIQQVHGICRIGCDDEHGA